MPGPTSAQQYAWNAAMNSGIGLIVDAFGNPVVVGAKMTGAAANGYVLTSDASGNLTLQPNTAVTSVLTTAGDLLYENSTPAPARLPIGSSSPAVQILGVSSGLPAWVNQNYTGLFGDGSDGSVTFDGITTILGLAPAANVYTMTRDIYCTSITINNGVTVKPAGARIFCAGTVTNNGTISVAGNAGLANGTAGGSTGSTTTVGGRAGGAGSTTNGAAGGASATVGTNTGGAGGAGSTGTAGAGGTTAGTATWWARNPYGVAAGTFYYSGNTTNPGPLYGGPGGGGGGGDNSNTGGGGGSGGGVIVIFAWAVNNGGGTITVAGGAGGTPTAGNAGGGGGGSGGLILAYTLSAWTAGTTSAAAGAAGSLHGGSGAANGSAGGAGTVLNVVLA